MFGGQEFPGGSPAGGSTEGPAGERIGRTAGGRPKGAAARSAHGEAEAVALLLQPRQQGAQRGHGLRAVAARVVEEQGGPVGQLAPDGGDDGVRARPLEVLGVHVPAQRPHPVRRGELPAVRRERAARRPVVHRPDAPGRLGYLPLGVQDLLRLVRLGLVVHGGVVRHRVVAQPVPGRDHLLDDVRVRLRLGADHAERRLDAVLPQHLEHLRGPGRVGAVVDGDVDGVRAAVGGVGDDGGHGHRLRRGVVSRRGRGVLPRLRGPHRGAGRHRRDPYRRPDHPCVPAPPSVPRHVPPLAPRRVPGSCVVHCICQDGGEGARAPAVTDQGQFRDNAWTLLSDTGGAGSGRRGRGGPADATGHRPLPTAHRLARLLP
ncbi:hypothetical protein GPN2_13903 [Streptomyces murinus]